jgi:hypothetical protein
MHGPLYHFTCEHGRRDIGTGPNCLLIPNMHPILRTRLLWLTTEAEPVREATGLTSTYIRCDRMQFRYIVEDLRSCRPWLGSPERACLSAEGLRAFEDNGNGTARPDEWWISDRPVRARYDRSWRPVQALA